MVLGTCCFLRRLLTEFNAFNVGLMPTGFRDAGCLLRTRSPGFQVLCTAYSVVGSVSFINVLMNCYHQLCSSLHYAELPLLLTLCYDYNVT